MGLAGSVFQSAAILTLPFLDPLAKSQPVSRPPAGHPDSFPAKERQAQHPGPCSAQLAWLAGAACHSDGAVDQ